MTGRRGGGYGVKIGTADGTGAGSAEQTRRFREDSRGIARSPRRPRRLVGEPVPLAPPRRRPIAAPPASVPPSDAALLAAVRAGGDGRDTAFAELCERHAAALYRVAHRIAGNPADAADARQQALLALLRSPPADDANVGGWLRRCAANAAVTLARSNARRRRRHAARSPPAPPPDPAAAAETNEEAARLAAALAGLPPDRRALLALRYDGGLTVAEVAAALGLPPATAADRLRRTLRDLQTALTPPPSPPSPPPR